MSTPVRVLLYATLLALVGGLLLLRAGEARARVAGNVRPLVASDTDSVAVSLEPDDVSRFRPAAGLAAADSLLADTTLVDSLAPDTGRAARYLPRRRVGIVSALVPRRQPLTPGLPSNWLRTVVLDSTRRALTIREQVAGQDVRVPLEVDFDTYAQARLDAGVDEQFRTLAEQRARAERGTGRGGPLFNVVIPGGRQSAFSTIFGKNEVSLRVNGQANINAGFDYRKSEQQAAFGRGSQLDPTFKQDLSLAINGTIGDKLRVDVNWDTQSQFDYQNQLKLQYTGYEDEIIQKIEAGNVFLQTPSSLIRGGQALFGIKSEFQIGGVRLTTVASQQEGTSSSLNISGGAETVSINLRATDYDPSTHFFLAYYFRNSWEFAHSQPPVPLIRATDDEGRPGVEKIEAIEVWKLQNINQIDPNKRSVIAIADLGERPVVLQQSPGQLYTSAVSPSPLLDQYSDAELQNNVRRSDTSSADDYLSTQKKLRKSDYQPGNFKLLDPGRDYELDPTLGFISLKQRLTENEALAVAFRYRTTNGQVVQVGDFSAESGGSDGSISDGALVVKLLRGTNPVAPSPEFVPATWYLELRNVYNLRGGGIRQDDFELEIEYQPPSGTAQNTLPNDRVTLLQRLGLDRIGPGGSPGSDNLFDFNTLTIDAGRGLLFFPYLEPFGRRIEEVNPSGQALAFNTLYTTKQETAKRETRFDVYRITGSYQGSAQSFFDLRAWSGLVPGSVRVQAGGVELAEGVDFQVDYTGTGTLTIINQAYVNAGRDIEISYEQNSMFDLQKKTLLGARADYTFRDNLQLGATLMRMSQRSQVDKFRIGEEPIANTIWGLDGHFSAEPRWITQLVDALPLLQTRAPSLIDVRGEFAQLRPSQAQTVAFRQTRRDLRDDGFDFYPDELDGVSFVDDFESFENTYSLKAPGTWRLAAPPDSVNNLPVAVGGGVGGGSRNDSLRTTWRAGTAWYQINQNILRELNNPRIRTPKEAIEVPRVTDIYPDRPVTGSNGVPETVTTLDFYFDPFIRGPYNYTTDLATFFSNPKSTWGGIVTTIPEGYRDFNNKNVEFVEFVVRAFAENPANDPGPDAYLYVDLGTISEDVLPDQRLNTEDGLSLQDASARSRTTAWGREADLAANGVIDQDRDTRRIEDLGLDGLVSYNTDPYDTRLHEATFFSSFVQSLTGPRAPGRQTEQEAEIARSLADPSGDDYHHYLDDNYFNNPAFFPERATVQQRFLRFFAGQELNSFEGQNEYDRNSSVKRGNSRLPDTEDLNNNSVADRTNNYYQYRIPLSKAELDRLGAPGMDDDYVVGEIVGSEGTRTGYYQIRLPVRDFTRRVGDATDFTAIQSIRLWTTGHEVPVTMRFATFELVGSQWQKSELVQEERSRTVSENTRFTISSINTEEDSRVYRKPPGTVTPINRGISGGQVEAREQSLVLNVEALEPGGQVGIFKVYNQEALDLLKYSNIRMFAHLHGSDLTREWDASDRGRAVLFVRFGANQTDSYYEYEQPLTPSSEISGDDRLLWLNDQNAVNIEIAAFNQLKFARDNRGVPANEVFYSVQDGEQLPDAPDATRFAPAGTRLGIKGNPSLNNVNTIVIGLRNPADSLSNDPNSKVQQAVLWVNELRVSGYDQTNGWSGLANVDLRLADFASVRAAFQAQTDGFGSLTSTLSERDQNATLNWSVNTDLRLDKFIPPQYGWTIPLNLNVQSNTTTPRYSPTRGDVRLDAILDGIDQQEDLSRAERESRKQQEIEAAQTRQHSRSLALNGVSKNGSQSAFLRNTLDGVSVTFATSEREQSSAAQRVNDEWRWNTAFQYRLPNQQPKTLRPFWFLDEVPVVGLLGDLRYNYIPTTVQMSAAASRSFAVLRERRSFVTASARDTLPSRIGYPFREQHAFTHGRDFGIQYNPFVFLRTSFDTGVDQSLSRLGIDTVYNAVRLVDGVEQARPITRLEALQLEDDPFAAEFVERRVRPAGFGSVVSRAFSGDDRFRTEGYTQNFTATFSPRLSRRLQWLVFQDLAYNARYNWSNGAIGQDYGAGVRTQVTVGAGLTVRPETFWSQFDFYKTLQREQREAEARAQAERQRKEAEARQRREDRRAERDRRREEEARRKEAEARGEIPEPGDLADEDVADEDVRDEDVADVVEEVPPGSILADTTGTPAADSTRARSRFRLPLPSGRSILRRTVLTLGGITDMRVQYTGGYANSATNVAEQGDGTWTPYSLYDALRGRGPTLGYRLGFTRTLPDEDRVLVENLQVRDNLTDSHKLTASTSLKPSPDLTVNLSWDVSWQSTEDQTLRFENGGVQRQSAFGGQNKAFVWAFGADYGDLFARQVNAFRADADLVPGDTISDANGDGRIALTNRSVIDDFRRTFTRGLGTLDGQGLLPFPMPGWQISYNGISRWPLIRSIAQSATLRHAYNADYSTGYRSNPEDQFSTFQVAQRTVLFELPRYEGTSVNVNERFAPLVGLDLRLKGNVGATMQLNQTNLYTLSPTNFQVTQRESDELSVSLNYQKQGLKLPFVRSKLNNRVTLALAVQRSVNDERQFKLRRAVEAAITDPTLTRTDVQRGDFVGVVTSTTRLTVTPTIGYQFSNAVQGNFSLKYERFDSADSRTPSFTNLTGLFTFRVSISSN